MPIDEVLRIRRFWSDLAGIPRCYHTVLGPIRDRSGCLTGIYACTRGGAEVLRSYLVVDTILGNAAAR